MKYEREGKIRGIYWLFQVNMTFNSNKIEGSKLSKEQTQYLFDEEKIYIEDEEGVSVNDIQEAINHFKTFDYILDNCNESLTTDMIKKIHYLIKQNTSDAKNPLTPIGEFKKVENIIGSLSPTSTAPPEKVEGELAKLLTQYENKGSITLEDIVEFHHKFEKIHPFADGNGRVGRLIAFKECLRAGIVPAIILDKYRHFYLIGLKEYDEGSKERLLDTFKTGQDYSNLILNQMNFQSEVNKRATEKTSNEWDVEI